MFSSKTPRDLNHDPHPWAVYVWPHSPIINASMRYATEDEAKRQAIGSYIHGRKPRPEFDHVQHNPPNPILVAARADVLDDGETIADLYEWWLWQAESYAGSTWTEEHIDHARKVLQRLANLARTRADYRYAELQEIMDRMYNGGPAATKAEIEEWEAVP